MIIVKLMGGLGNQMFQYAFAYNLSKKLSARLLIEPIRSMMIDIRLDKTFTKEYSELFKGEESPLVTITTYVKTLIV